MGPLAAYALAVILALVPVASHRPPPGWQETLDAREARMRSIADDIAAVSQTRTDVAVLVAVAAHESAMAADVDAGACYRSPLPAWVGRCDGGRAWTIFQMQSGRREEIATWKGSRREAAREALRRIRMSIGACRHLPREERLAMYASGGCSGEAGKKAARALDGFVVRAMRVPFVDVVAAQ